MPEAGGVVDAAPVLLLLTLGRCIVPVLNNGVGGWEPVTYEKFEDCHMTVSFCKENLRTTETCL